MRSVLGFQQVMDRITATAIQPHVFIDNRNCNTVVSITIATAVIFFNNHAYLKTFFLRKSVFTYDKVRIVILSSHPTNFFFNRASHGIHGLILFLKFVILKFL